MLRGSLAVEIERLSLCEVIAEVKSLSGQEGWLAPALL